MYTEDQTSKCKTLDKNTLALQLTLNFVMFQLNLLCFCCCILSFLLIICLRNKHQSHLHCEQ